MLDGSMLEMLEMSAGNAGNVDKHGNADTARSSYRLQTQFPSTLTSSIGNGAPVPQIIQRQVLYAEAGTLRYAEAGTLRESCDSPFHKVGATLCGYGLHCANRLNLDVFLSAKMKIALHQICLRLHVKSLFTEMEVTMLQNKYYKSNLKQVL
ncbi:MAG: hypothetical protein ACR5LF_13820 [Symbiopectobacterium sp.]